MKKPKKKDYTPRTGTPRKKVIGLKLTEKEIVEMRKIHGIKKGDNVSKLLYMLIFNREITG